MATQIIGDKGKRKRYDPDLARKVNEAVEREREEKKERKGELETKVSEDKGTDEDIEAICKNYEEYMKTASDYWGKCPDINPDIKPSEYFIEEFVKFLPRYKELEHFEVATAPYLSALMMASEDNEFVLDFRRLNKEGIVLDYVGCNLHGKNLTIKGDVGFGFGVNAKNAHLRLHGNAERNVGFYAKDSSIYVSGSAGDKCGQEAKNSEITIAKNVGESLGSGAENSIIKVRGIVGKDIGIIAVKSKIYVPYMLASTNLSDMIGRGTEVYGKKGDKDFLVYPESRWMRFKKWLPKL